MLASGGYPEKYEKGKKIDFGASESMAEVFHSGTARDESGNFVTAGGRVLGVCCERGTLPEAIAASYAAAKEIRFDKMHFRSDIGARALRVTEV